MFDLNMNNFIYLISVFLLSFFICFMLSMFNFLTNDSMISYLLSLIASNSILKELKKSSN